MMSGARRLMAALNLGSLRMRLALSSIALLGLVLVVFSAFVYLHLARNLYAEADALLAHDAQRLITLVEVDEGVLETPIPTELLAEGLLVTIDSWDGRRLFTLDAHSILPRLTVTQIRSVPTPWRLGELTDTQGGRWRILAAAVMDDDAPVAVVQIARSQREVEAALGQLLTQLALAVPATLIVASLGALYLADRALAPIDRLTRTAEAIGVDDLTRRLPVPTGHDEVQRLAIAFNQLLSRLERAFQRQRQFTADASHELRTPLAVLASQADVALSRPRSAADYRATIADMRDDVERLNALVSQLLMLARADAGQEELEWERLLLSDLVADAVLSLQPLAEGHGVRLTTVTGQPVAVEGDQTRLTALVVNLIDNALTHTPAGGEVTVQARPAGDWSVVVVSDTGVGIGPEHLPHLFERFYRADAARAASRRGTGLGLAICRWIVEAHGGDIAVASTVGVGTTVTVRLPPTRRQSPADPSTVAPSTTVRR